MSIVVDLVAIACLVTGAVFLVLAALGVLRFADPLQRMHASTKAGTVGAIFMVLGAVVAEGGAGAVLVGLAAIAFLLLTVPVAGHLLGRAIYVSGARLEGLEGRDALAGKIERRETDED